MKRLKGLRAQNGITQQQLACMVGISQAYLSELENGRKYNPSISVVKNLAAVLGVDMLQLLDDNFPEAEVVQNAAD